MKILCIVSCGRRKIWDKYPGLGAVRARDAYTGPLVRLAVAYAEKYHPNSWVILSAKYGFLYPNELIPGPYDVSFKRRSPEVISIEELRRQVLSKGLEKYDAIMVLAGKTYVDVVRKVFAGKTIYAPLEGLPLGKMMRKLKDAIESGKPLVKVDDDG